MKKNNKLTIAGADANVTISKIVFLFDNSSDPGLSASVGSTSNSYTDNSTTWTGEANTITFTAGSSRLIKTITVTYTGSAAPVEKVPVLAITKVDNFNTTYDMDATDNKTLVAYYENTGNGAAENAKLTLFVDNVENKVVAVGTIAAGATNGWKNISYDLTKIEAGEHSVYVALTADGVDAVKSETKTVTFTKKAPEATFSVSAQNVNVAYDATSYDVVATVKNTSTTVAATGVQVLLQRSLQNVADPQTIDLAAGEEKQVTFTVTAPDGGFAAGATTMFVMVKAYEKNVAQQEVTVTVAEAPKTKKDLAITGIDGTIELANETSNVRVSVQNNGEVAINDAAVTLKAGEKVLGTATVSAAAGQTGFCYVAVASEGLEAGELEVTATLEVEGDETPADNTKTATLTVKAVPVPEATLVLTAADKEFTFGVDELTFTVNVKNTSEVDAENVNVNIIYKGVVTIATKNIAKLAAGENVDLVFTAADVTIPGVDASMLPAGTYSFAAMTDGNKFGTTFTITVKQPVAQVVDINLIDIRGISEINLKETNTVMVTFTNESNFDVENATITLKMNGAVVGTETIAKGETSKSFTLSSDGLNAGDEVTLVATLSVENNKEGNTAEVTKTLKVVSGEAEPQAVIALNPVSNQELDAAGEQTITVSVGVFNNGDADAENVEVVVYKDLSTNLDSKTVSIPAGESQLVTLSFTYDVQGTTEFHVAAKYNNVVADFKDFTVALKVELPDVAVQKIDDIQATTEENVLINATLKNNSAIDATDVKVGVYKLDDSYQYQLVGLLQSIETIAAAMDTTVTFNLGQLEEGTYKYYVRVTNEDANTENNVQDVTVKVTAPVVKTVDVALTAIQGISNIDLAEGTSNTITVWAENKGNTDAEAKISVKLNATDLEPQTISLKAGKSAGTSFTLPTEGLVAGEKATVVATVTVEENASEATTLTREYDIVNSTVATEPVFEVSAADVEVEFGAEKFNVVATVKNVSTVAAENVAVNLFYNQVIATQTVDAIAANGEATVTFEVENPFTKAGEYTMYVQAPKAQAEVKVTVKPEVVAEVKDLAIIEVIGTIEKANETGNVRVSVQNNGNVAIADAPVTLKAGEKVLGTATVSAAAGQTGYCIIAVATAELEAGELEVTAAVEVEGDATPADNTMTTKLTVKDVPAAELTLVLTANDIELTKGQDDLEFTVHVANTSTVDAENVKVNIIYQGILTIASKTIEKVAAGQETDLVFTAADVTIPGVSSNDMPVGTYNLSVMTEDKKFGTTFTLTVKEAVAEVVDLAISSISGALSLDVETNYVTVFVENKGTVDAKDAVVTLKAGETVLGTGTVNAKAGNTGFCSIAVTADKLQAGEFTVTASVEVEGDVDLTNNTMDKTYTIAAPAAELSFEVAEVSTVKDAASFDVKVTVSNTGKGAAENVAVKVYDEGSAVLGEATIASIAAGAQESVTITVNKTYTEVGTFKSQLQVWVAGVEGVKWVAVTVTSPATSIEAIKAVFGENVQIFTLGGKKVSNVQKGQVYIINGNKVVIK